MPVLLIDSYDSFTYNLHKQVERVTGTEVITVHNDKISDEFFSRAVEAFDAVIVGPGPGSPSNPSDIGIIPKIWQHVPNVPVLGVCLGFQSLVHTFGGEIARLDRPRHGQTSKISHNGHQLFANIPQGFVATRYHSLFAPSSGPLVPLAWSEDKILMAIKHEDKPFYGVQYHPESICTTFGDELIGNFWLLAQKYNSAQGRVALDSELVTETLAKYSAREHPLSDTDGGNGVGNGANGTSGHQKLSITELPFVGNVNSDVTVSVCDWIRSLNDEGQEFVLLNSARDPGRWSIIGMLVKHDTPIFSSVDAKLLRISTYRGTFTEEIALSHSESGISSMWSHIDNFMRPKIAQFKHADTPLPFIGGLVGNFTYEDDLSLAFIETSIVLDSQENRAYLVSIAGEKHQGLAQTLKQAMADFVANKTVDTKPTIPRAEIAIIDRQKYVELFDKCQHYLHSGDSYELCLTAKCKISLETEVDPWDLYKVLVTKNPAPYSCFLNFDRPMVGSSPERFVSWSRSGTCEFRPIKGTVKKGPGMTEEKAVAILNTDKERGENLMIVDLIRHDLNQLLDNVRVDKLMTIEEYHTVYQLVSVIRGELQADGYRGIDVLATSLPPGSMTGAPKKRSVDILKSLELTPRGSYSGVSGYWSVTDEGDWSVVIRTLFQEPGDPKTVWKAGAGGAITVLSNAQDEWDEMLGKLDSVLKVFDH